MSAHQEGPSQDRRSMLRAKLHRARVTQADLDYEGSITIDRALMEAADILPYEEVYVWNVTRGTRFNTYAMLGDTGVICVNGAAAHLAKPGDIVIIATFTQLDNAAACNHEPLIVLLDEQNRIQEVSYREAPGPYRRT